MARLTNKGQSLLSIYILSLDYYSKFDNKQIRATLDVKKTKLIKRHNLKYDPKTKTWVQSGRDYKIECLVTTDPISYKRKSWDEGKKHYFPVTFLIHNLNNGLDSTFKWRTGSLKKPKFPNNNMSKEMKQKLQEKNIKNRIQMQFFFELEYVLYKNNLLYGKNYASYAPEKTNPDQRVFFDKHSYYVFTKIIYPFITSKKHLNKNLSIKNDPTTQTPQS